MEKLVKSIIVFCLLLCAAGFLFAEDPVALQPDSPPPPDGPFFGIGPEINAHTRDGWAIGGNLLLGTDINSRLATGIKTGFFHNLNTIFTAELQGFLRIKLPLHWPSELDGPFLQAEAGLVTYFEYGVIFPAFSGGLSAGWRFNFADHGGVWCYRFIAIHSIDHGH